MRTNEEMAALALAFYDAYMEALDEGEPGRADKLKCSFHGIDATAAAFMGALLGHFYEEAPWIHHVFLAGIQLRGWPVGTVGIYGGFFSREEIVSVWNGLGNILMQHPEMFLDEEESEAKT